MNKISHQSTPRSKGVESGDIAATRLDKAVAARIPVPQPGSMVKTFHFFREGYVKFAKTCLLLSIALVLSIGLNAAQWAYGVRYHYYGVSPDGRLTEIAGYGRPIWTDPQILAWATVAANQSYTYGYDTLQRDLSATAEYYSRDGWKGYFNEMSRPSLTVRETGKQVGIVEYIGIKKINVVGISRNPTITKRREPGEDGPDYWIVQMPIEISYISLTETVHDSRVVVMKIIRQPQSRNPVGIAIDQINLQKGVD